LATPFFAEGVPVDVAVERVNQLRIDLAPPGLYRALLRAKVTANTGRLQAGAMSEYQ
jgi:hypothetical protein